MGALAVFGVLGLVLGFFLLQYYIRSLPEYNMPPIFHGRPILLFSVGLVGFLLALSGVGCIVAFIIKLF